MSTQPTMSNPQRALQVWSLLSLAALTRTILTYEEVAQLTGLPNNSGNVLGYLYHYCRQRNLPLLPSLVVDKYTGRPSAPIYADVEISDEHRRCFRHDWLSTPIPTIEDLETAHERRHAMAV
jgi:alkylated DNA nucleotide flippase Atl1